MIPLKRRQQLYSKTFMFMRERNMKYVPVNLTDVCRNSGVDLLPLSQIVRESGLSKSDVFSIWGNEDGSVNTYNNKHRIAYNDGCCAGRIRFTICEELGHIICGHTQDAGFDVFHQSYDEDVYAQYDEEARMVAGFLVCHPKFFYTYEDLLDPKTLSDICGITLPCALTRRDILRKHRHDIEDNVVYHFLPIPRVNGGMRRYEKGVLSRQALRPYLR